MWRPAPIRLQSPPMHHNDKRLNWLRFVSSVISVSVSDFSLCSGPLRCDSARSISPSYKHQKWILLFSLLFRWVSFPSSKVCFFFSFLPFSVFYWCPDFPLCRRSRTLLLIINTWTCSIRVRVYTERSTYYFEGFYICLGALIKNELVHQDFVQIHSSLNDLLSIVNRDWVGFKRV